MIKAKRFLAIILSLIILACCCPAVFAAESTPVITLSNKSVMPGDTVTIDIDISNNPGIMAMTFCVTYDSDAFEYVSYQKGYIKVSPQSKNHSDKGHVSFAYVENSKTNPDNATNGTIMSLTFNVKEKAAPGKHIITLANNNRDKYGNDLYNSFSNSKQQFIVPLVKAGSITVGETCTNAGHKYGDWTVIKESSCTKAGRREHTCVRCEYVEEADAPLADHEFDDNWTVVTESTCTENGAKERTCLNCDFTEKSDIALADHDYEVDWTVDRVATKTENGIMSRHCKNCVAVTDTITFTLQDVEDSENGENDTSSENSSSPDGSSENSSSNDASSNISSSENTSSSNGSTESNSSEATSSNTPSADNTSSDAAVSGNNSSENNSSATASTDENSSQGSASDDVFSNEEPVNSNQSQNGSSVSDTSGDDTQSDKQPTAKPPINNTLGAKNPLSAVEDLKDYQENIKPNLPSADNASDSADGTQADTDGNKTDNNASQAVDGEANEIADNESQNNTTEKSQNQSFFAKYKVAIISIICVLALAAILVIVFI